MFAESTLAEIRQRLSIVELVSEYVQLKKAGQGYLGLCPFHKEKSPSFHVHPIRQCFHCFGCQKGGNVFSFLCAVEGLSFPDAVQRLAKKAGVTIEEVKRREMARPEPTPEAKRCLAANEWAAKYFNYLLMETADGKFAREYLKKRGLEKRTIEKFRIGVSPAGWNTLLNLMRKRGFSLKELNSAGLVVERTGSPTGGYDRFRERLMFPIADPEGNTIGFGARLLTEEKDQPKYLNSTESPLFSKRRVLYGLFENQRGIRLKGEAALVEGYMDVVGLYQCGVDNAVATMGTAMTEDHLTLLRGLTRKVVTVFDPDAAGSEAWHRSVHLLLGAGFFAKDLSLPDGKDPDEFALEHGAEKFYELCEKAPRQVTKLLKEIASRGPLGEEASAKLLQELTPILVASRRLPDRATLWDDISLVLKVSVSALKELAEGAVAAAARPARGGEPKSTMNPALPRKPSTAKPASLNPVDLDFFQACVKTPEAFLAAPKETWLGGLREERVKKWLEQLSGSQNREHFELTLEKLMHAQNEPALVSLASAGLLRDETSQENISIFNALVESMRSRSREKEIKSLSIQVKLTQRLGNLEDQLKLLERLKALRAT